MTHRDTPIEDVQAANLADVLEHGPGLRIRENFGGGSYVVAKDTAAGYVELGGLGGLGVGVMWFRLTDNMVGLPGWDTAPDGDTKSTDEFGMWRRFLDPLLEFEASERRPSVIRGTANFRSVALARARVHHDAWLYAGGVCRHDHTELLRPADG